MRHLRIKPLLAPGDICHVAISSIPHVEVPSRHDHDFMEIFLVLEGIGRHFINGRRIDLQAGDLVFIRASDCHSFTGRDDTALRILNVAFPRAWFRRFRGLLPPEPAEPRWLRSHLPLSIRLLPVVRDSLKQRGIELIALQGPRHFALARFCLEACALFRERPVTSPPAPPPWLAQCVAAMENTENQRHEFAWFQRRAARSPEHLARECRRCYGVPPTELLNRARIRQAMARLLESGGKVIDVALDCGFNNLGYFHRTFLRIAGCTPRRWRVRNSVQVPR